MNILIKLLSLLLCISSTLGKHRGRFVHTSRVEDAADDSNGKDFSKMWYYVVKQMSQLAQSHSLPKFGKNLSKDKQKMDPSPNYENPEQNDYVNVSPPMYTVHVTPEERLIIPPYTPMVSEPVPDTPMPSEPVPGSTTEPSYKVTAKQRPMSPDEKSRGRERYCTEEYRKIPGHTLCMRDNPSVYKSGMTRAEQEAVLRHHNELRDTVDPPATDLVKLKWDDRLAAVAQKWANQCKLGHDKVRSVPSVGMSIGQNVGGGYGSWHSAVQGWYDEISMWRYGPDPDSYLGKDGWRKIGHFTQIVQNGTYLVGCGYAECRGTEYPRYYVCDYAAGQYNLGMPYTSGRRCAACQNGLCGTRGQCDCHGRICMNGGKLNPSTCQCTCVKPYTGPTCEDLNCPEEDGWYCGKDYPPSYCKKFTNVPGDCPYMCGLCKRSGGGSGGKPGCGSAGKPGGSYGSIFVSEQGCKYKGKRSSPQECRNYGDKGKDTKDCDNRNGQFKCSDCERYSNVKKDYCPVMCGLCDPPCNGKKCQNGGDLDVDTCSCKCKIQFSGTYCENPRCNGKKCKNRGRLDLETCSCKCKKPFYGTYCENKDCSKEDPFYCSDWPKTDCDEYYNVPEDCPFLCGIC